MFIFTLLLKSKLDTISLFYGILNALEHYRTIERFKLLIFNNIMIGQDLFKQRDGALSGTRTHATGFGDLYSIQLSYERLYEECAHHNKKSHKVNNYI